MDAKELTDERKGTHGNWAEQAAVAVSLKNALRAAPGWVSLPTARQEALDMIAVKLSRIVSGDHSHADHWDDIAGYAYLGKGGHQP